MIKKIFKNHSKATDKDKSDKYPSLLTYSKNPTPTLSSFELPTMFEDMNTNILHSLAMQIDTMQLKMKRDENRKYLVIFYPRVGGNIKRFNVLLILWMFVGYLLKSTLLINAHFFPL